METKFEEMGGACNQRNVSQRKPKPIESKRSEKAPNINAIPTLIRFHLGISGVGVGL
jgi:hypothetical protein